MVRRTNENKYYGRNRRYFKEDFEDDFEDKLDNDSIVSKAFNDFMRIIAKSNVINPLTNESRVKFNIWKIIKDHKGHLFDFETNINGEDCFGQVSVRTDGNWVIGFDRVMCLSLDDDTVKTLKQIESVISDMRNYI